MNFNPKEQTEAASASMHPEHVSNFLKMLLHKKPLTYTQYGVVIEYLMLKRNEQSLMEGVNYAESIVPIMTNDADIPEDPDATTIENIRVRNIFLCVKNDDENEVLLVSTRSRPDLWTIPVGRIARDDDPNTTAGTGVFVEAGVIGKVGRCLGKFENLDRKHRTVVFVLTVTQELPVDSGMNFRWFDVKEAIAKFETYPVQLSYLNALVANKKEPEYSSRCL